MHTKWPRVLAMIAMPAALNVACQRPLAPEGLTRQAIPAGSLEELWDASLAVLQTHDFRPDRQDRASGIITTHPTTSQHFWELWRQDVADPYGFAHASLHTTQRKATVQFIRGEPATKAWSLHVQVDVYRLTTPEHQITTASSAIQGFSAALPTSEGRVVGDVQGARRWVHLGRDGEMEWRLLQQILERSGIDMIPADAIEPDPDDSVG